MKVTNILKAKGINPIKLIREMKIFIDKFESDMKTNIGTNEEGQDYDHCSYCQNCRGHRDKIVEIMRDNFKFLGGKQK